MTKLTLTFDNGPTPGVTERVLATLADRGLAATFFVVGDRLAEPGGRALVDAAHRQGHWIGNHTMHHGPPLGEWADGDAACEEIAELQAALGDCAHERRFFRPNGRGEVGTHLLNPTAVQYLTEHRYSVVLWSIFVRDSKMPTGWAQRALDQLGRREWDVVVLHDVASGAMAELGEFVDEVLDRGITIEQGFPEDLLPIDRGVITPAAAAVLSAQFSLTDHQH